jgi:hypothetical protein
MSHTSALHTRPISPISQKPAVKRACDKSIAKDRVSFRVDHQQPLAATFFPTFSSAIIKVILSYAWYARYSPNQKYPIKGLFMGK